MRIPTITACCMALLFAASLSCPAYGATKKGKDKMPNNMNNSATPQMLAAAKKNKAKATPKKAKAEKKSPKATSDDPYGNAVDVFVAKDGNPYASIRIPDIINVGGTLVAAAEGRYRNTDQGNNDIIVSLSKDGGKRWSEPVVAAAANGATFNNPCLIYHKASKNIILFFQCYPKGVSERGKDIQPGWKGEKTIRNYVCFSKNGKRWTKPKDVTEFTKHDDAILTCSGPNPGVLLTRGEHKGRLCVPFNEGSFGDWRLAAAYSDDGGKTWNLGKQSAAGGGVNEVSMAETEDGGLIIVSRAWGGGQRKVAYSKDGGETWGDISSHPELPSPNCQNGLVRYSFADDEKLGGRGRLLFSSPSKGGRVDGIVKMSYDDGQTWPVEKVIGSGPYGYSALTVVKPGVIGLLFEVNGNPLTTIRFTTFTMEWLTDGEDDGISGSGDSDGEDASDDAPEEDGEDEWA